MKIPVHWLKRRAGGAVQSGLEFEDLLRRSFLPVQDTGTVEVTMAQFFMLTLNIIKTLEDEKHGFSSDRLRRGHTSIMATCLLERSTIEDALERVVRYLELSASGISVKVSTTRRVVSIAIGIDTRNHCDSAVLEDAWAAYLVMLLSWFSGQKIPIVDMQVRTPDHPSIGQRHLILECPVMLGEVTTIRVPTQILGQTRRAGPSNNLHRDTLENFMRLGRFDGTLRPSRALRNARVVDLATERLLHSRESLDQIAVSLGYSEARSLRRLIKLKTGKTPQELRAIGRVPPIASGEGMQLAAKARVGIRDLMAMSAF